MEGKVAVLGDPDFVMPFAAMGLETFAVVNDRQQVLIAAKKVASGGYTLIVLAENVAGLALEVLDPLQKAAVPCVVVVPFTTESKGLATQVLADVLKVATGISIMGNTRVTSSNDTRKA